MNNRDISDVLAETARLMELHGLNEFKTRSLQNAAFTISRLESPLAGMSEEAMSEIKGIGKSISQKVGHILQSGTLPELEQLLGETPKGVVEMMAVKGIGPKKVAALWKQLGIESPGELLYACNENRLVELKGFGAKTQEQIRKSIEYALSAKGFFHYAALEPVALRMAEALQSSGEFGKVSLSGPIRRKCEVLQQIDILVSCDQPSEAPSKITALEVFAGFTHQVNNDTVFLAGPGDIRVAITLTNDIDFPVQWFLGTGSQAHLEQLRKLDGFDEILKQRFDSEHRIYEALGLRFIEPEMREGMHEIELARAGELPVLIAHSDLRGSLHNHSTYSDGQHTLREMAVACRDLGYEYLGICDHSKSAFYANGMSVERILQQHLEIDRLNQELAPFRIFKGIESDILPDGSLDYPDSVLQQFEFIVASVHSGLKMSMEKATERILKAVSNPYTTILGHPTGRLLLAREGYPIDHKAVIESCARHGVVIELNAHPYRLDLDWRWIRYALSKNVMISINPDAHHRDGFHDMYFGVCVARKGGLTRQMTFNTFSAADADKWFALRRSQVPAG